ncbi:hypothetical protein DSECCO2_500820 [anaerobic digester metagenome]
MVRNSIDPSFAPLFFFTLFVSTIPVTARPNIGSDIFILCPPARGIPALSQTSLAPATTSAASDPGSFSRGHPSIAIAIIGLPPIAYMSDIALVAEIRPKSLALSTIGVKKSVVLIIAFPSPISYTAASSLLSFPTIRFGKLSPETLPFRISSRSLGAILHPQPAPGLNCVRRVFSLLIA